jgi:tetratricopeptide (TPR) repeat protein
MPSHVYMHMGDYEAAARSNEAAIAADRAYIKTYGPTGDYPMYLGHNIDFLRYAHSMAGRYRDALNAADQLAANVAAELAGMSEMPSRERYLAAPLLVRARCYRWDEILALPDPGEKRPRTLALWRYARTLAYAAKGDARAASAERALFIEAGQRIPAASGFGLNDWGAARRIAEAVLDGKIALARGDAPAAVERLREAVTLQDALAYNETPDWYFPVRESLGAALLRAGRPADAEAVFRDDLARNPRSGRSLFGLAESLARKGDAAGAALARRQYETAWRRADIRLRAGDL